MVAQAEATFSVETAALTALVAAFVTLSIEWAAKPRLEARKERILERARASRRVRQTLANLVRSAASWPSPEMWVEAPSEAERRLEAVRAMARNLEEADVDWAVSTDSGALHALSSLAGFVQGSLFNVSGSRRGEAAAAAIREVASPLLDWISTPRWRTLRRRKLVRMARAGLTWLPETRRSV